MTAFFPMQTTPFEISTVMLQTVRSHSIHSHVKHCIESTLLESSPSYHIGFSPYPNQRAMVSFLRLSHNSTYLFETKGGSTSHKYKEGKNIEYYIGETYLVCLDSDKKEIISINGVDKRKASYDYFDDAKEWHVFFDASSYAQKDPITLSINLGFKPFQNTIPEGFSPWIFNISSYQGLKRKKMTYYCRRNSQNIMIIFMFINSQ